MPASFHPPVGTRDTVIPLQQEDEQVGQRSREEFLQNWDAFQLLFSLINLDRAERH